LGSYNVAVTAFGILNSVPSAISGTLFPFYSHFYRGESKSSETIDLENAVETASRYVSFLTIPLSVGLAATALPAATLLAGNNYADAAYPLAVLSISLAVACQARALGQIFVVLGKTVTSALVTIGSVLLTVLLGVVIVPRLGVAGASLARGSSLIIALVLSILILRMTLRLRFDKKAYGYAWVASLIMAGAVLIFEIFIYKKYLLPLYIVAGGVVFVLVLRWLHVLNHRDLELVDEFLGPRLKFLSGILQRIFAVQTTSGSEGRA
jgi:O-antigen/teichoic acid export membrane protein